MNVVVRKAEKSDFFAVRNIMNQVQELHVEWRPDIYKSNDDLISQELFGLMLDSGNLYVADVDGKVSGVLGVAYKHFESPAHITRNVIFIDSMAVESDFRGKGIGHLFFEKVKELKAVSGADAIELQVNAKNYAAFEMYKKYGFTEKSINMELL
ncbi:MAG: GNAT family N-acetyltransferase [Acetatifactor sp.]|nr:GNAT family N-acetyltransferase [Acetatifactor sp.]